MHFETRSMSARAWLIETICLTASLLIAVVLGNMSIDIYGIFRNAQGRYLLVYGDERVAKYLLSEKYVPDNFDALLIGSSVSANWNMGQIDGLRVYNESLNGGNIVEEKTLVDQALPGSRIHVVFLIIHPYLTSSHEFETVGLTPRENLAALGSQSLLDAYTNEVRIKLHREEQHFDEFGTDDVGDAPKKLNATLQKLMSPGTEFDADEVAMKTYKSLIDELHSAKVQIIYIVPPPSQSILASKGKAFANYSNIILASKLEQDRVIDFTTDEFVDFRSNPENFTDGIHLKNSAARQVIAVVNHRFHEWIRNR